MIEFIIKAILVIMAIPIGIGLLAMTTSLFGTIIYAIYHTISNIAVWINKIINYESNK